MSGRYDQDVSRRTGPTATIPPHPGPGYRFNSPPGWPPADANGQPPAGLLAGRMPLPRPPDGWQWWTKPTQRASAAGYSDGTGNPPAGTGAPTQANRADSFAGPRESGPGDEVRDRPLASADVAIAGSAWWKRQSRAIKLLLVAGPLGVLASLALPRSAWFLNWHNNLTGGTFTIAQAHAFCTNPLVHAVTVPGSVQAGDCSTANAWYGFFIFLLVASILALLLAGYLIYRQATAQSRGEGAGRQ